MSIDRTTSISTNVGGISIAGTISRTGTNEVNTDVNLPAGIEGVLSTRTDNDTGVVTVPAEPAHGLVATDKVDVFWPGGLKRAMTVGAGVTATSVPLDTGAGDNLPAVDDTVTMSKKYTVDVDFTAAIVLMAAASASRRCGIQFESNAGAAIKTLDLGRSGNPGEIWEWHSDGDITNPFSADVGQISLTNGANLETNFRFAALLGEPDTELLLLMRKAAPQQGTGQAPGQGSGQGRMAPSQFTPGAAPRTNLTPAPPPPSDM